MDGGYSSQGNPIWPFLHRSSVDVMFVVDCIGSYETELYPNGTDLHATYVQAQLRGLSRMPFVPDSTTFVAHGYNTRPITRDGLVDPSTSTSISPAAVVNLPSISPVS